MKSKANGTANGTTTPTRTKTFTPTSLYHTVSALKVLISHQNVQNQCDDALLDEHRLKKLLKLARCSQLNANDTSTTDVSEKHWATRCPTDVENCGH